MTSIIGKTIKGQTYYYSREVARVGGKPKVGSQRYLGKAADIEAAIAGATVMPDRTRHLAFGDVAATWSILSRLGVAEIVDDVVGARRADAGASVGTYIALATANRVVNPCSKLAFADRWAKTAGDRWLGVPAGALDHRRFSEAMDAISEDDLKEIEARIVAQMVERFAIDLSGLVLDMTNFATWIDSGNDRAPIAQRGHSKQKRNDLRIVGLGLVVSVDGGVPLVSHAYPGNKPDVTQFGAMVSELVTRFGALLADGGGDGDNDAGGAERLTLVYDAGQNSKDNYKLLDDSPLSFVGSLPPSDHPDLTAVSKNRCRVVNAERFAGLTALEARKVVFGKERRLVVCHSDGLHAKQSRGFTQTLAKAYRQLAELQARLARGKTHKARDKVEAEIAEILRPRWVSQVITWSLTGESGAEFRLRFSSDERARAALEEELFGKRILFTDKTPEQASTATIVAEYRSQEAVEGDFCQMKDTTVVSNSAMFHWTESKIRVHVFYCILGLTVARLMVREADGAGIQMSVRELLSTLAGIEETVLLYQGERGRPRARRMLTDIEPPLSVSTTSSVSMPMPPRAELGYEDVKAKLASATGRAGRFGKDDFTVDLETGEVACRAGNTAAIRTAENGSGLVDFAAQCTGCPLRASCTTSAAGRTVTIHPREDLLRSHKAAQRDRLAGGLLRHRANGGAQDRPLREPLLERTAGPGPRPSTGPVSLPSESTSSAGRGPPPAVSDDRPATTPVFLHPSVTPERRRTPRKTPEKPGTGESEGRRSAPRAPPDDPYERAPRHLTARLATGSPLLQESPRDARASPCRHCHLQDPTRQFEGCQSTLIALAGG